MLQKTTGAAARGYHKRRDAILLTRNRRQCLPEFSSSGRIREKHRPANAGAELASPLTVRANP